MTPKALLAWLESAPEEHARTLTVEVNVVTNDRVVIEAEEYWADGESDDDLVVCHESAVGRTVASALRKLRRPGRR